MNRVLTGTDRFCAAAGMLAERSVVLVELRGPDGITRRLSARTTDLPGELRRSAPGATLLSSDGSIRVEIRADELHWVEGLEGTRRHEG